MELSFLTNSLYTIQLYSFAIIESPYLLEKEIDREERFKSFFKTNWSQYHKSIGLSSLFMLFAPILFILSLLYLGFILGEYKYLSIIPLLIIITSIGGSVKHNYQRAIEKLYTLEKEECQIPVILPSLQEDFPISSNLEISLSSTEQTFGSLENNLVTVEPKVTIGSSLSSYPEIISIIQEFNPSQSSILLDLDLKNITTIPLRERVFLFDVILQKDKSLSTIIDKISIRTGGTKVEIWKVFSSLLKGSERNLRGYSETKDWHKEHINQSKTIRRVDKLQNYLSSNTEIEVNIKEFIKKGSLG